MRFYLSTPLVMDDGAVVGTLCAWDRGDDDLSDEQLAAFDDLALPATAVLQQPVGR